MTQEDLKFIRWIIFAFHCQGIKNHLSVSKDTLSDTLSQITHPFRYSLENTNVSVHKKCLYNQVVQDHFFFFFCKRGSGEEQQREKQRPIYVPILKENYWKYNPKLEDVSWNISPQRHSFMGSVAWQKQAGSSRVVMSSQRHSFMGSVAWQKQAGSSRVVSAWDTCCDAFSVTLWSGCH